MILKALDKALEIGLIAITIAIIIFCSYALTAGLLDRPPKIDGIPFNESVQCQSDDQCKIKVDIPNNCPEDALNC